MKNLGFFKGLVIGSLLSAAMWVGIFGVVNSFTNHNDTIQETIESPTIIKSPIARM